MQSAVCGGGRWRAVVAEAPDVGGSEKTKPQRGFDLNLQN